MAIKTASSTTPSRIIPRVWVKEYPSGQTLYLEPEGNTDYQKRTLACQTPKLRLLFDTDADGDNILKSIYDFVMNNVNPDDRPRIREAAEVFAKHILGD